MDVKKEKTIVNMVIPEEFKKLQQRLQSLIDTNPAKAVEEARSIPPDAKIEGIFLSGATGSSLEF